MRLQPLVAADAVLFMDDKIAGGEARRLGDELVEVAPPARRARQPVAQNILLAEHDQPVAREALFERQDHQSDGRLRQPGERRAIGHRPQIRKAALAQHRRQPLGGAGAVRGDRRTLARFALAVEMVAHRLEQIDLRVGALGGEILRWPRASIECRLAFRRGKRRKLDHRALVEQRSAPFVVGDETSGRA